MSSKVNQESPYLMNSDDEFSWFLWETSLRIGYQDEWYCFENVRQFAMRNGMKQYFETATIMNDIPPPRILLTLKIILKILGFQIKIDDEELKSFKYKNNEEQNKILKQFQRHISFFVFFAHTQKHTTTNQTQKTIVVFAKLEFRQKLADVWWLQLLSIQSRTHCFLFTGFCFCFFFLVFLFVCLVGCPFF